MVGLHCEMLRFVYGININRHCLLIIEPLILLWLTSIVIHLDLLLQIESHCLSLGCGAKSPAYDLCRVIQVFCDSQKITVAALS